MHHRIIKSKAFTFVITVKKLKQKKNTDLLAENDKRSVRRAAQNEI